MAILAAEKTVDFFIHELIPYNFFGQTVYITTTHVCELIIILGIIVFALIARHKIMHAEEVPRGFQNVVELLVETLQKYVYGSMGKHGTKCYVNYIGTIILLIFLCNISGLIGLRPPTADYGTTLCLAVISVIMIQYNNIKWNITSISLDGTGSMQSTYSMGDRKLYVMVPDDNTVNNAKENINKILNGK